MHRRLALLFLSALAGACTTARPGSAIVPPSGGTAVDAAVRDMCGRDVVLLGEATHWDGRTTSLKVEIVRRLIDECGFRGLFFEASHYDFLELDRRLRRGQGVTPELISSSIGGLWNRFQEIQPLISYLSARVTTGQVRLGGIDYQLGSAGAHYSITAMPAELADLLSQGDRDACREQLRKRIHQDYRRGEYGVEARESLAQCLLRMRDAAERAPADAVEREHLLRLIDNIDLAIANDFDAADAQNRARGHAMWSNLQWLRQRLPRSGKAIVWTASVHAARDATASDLFPSGGNLGYHVHESLGDRAFVMGFSALSGMHGMTATPIGLPGAVEATAFAGTGEDVVYLSRARLARLGPATAGFFRHMLLGEDWSRASDGAIIFREERPPQPLG